MGTPWLRRNLDNWLGWRPASRASIAATSASHAFFLSPVSSAMKRSHACWASSVVIGCDATAAPNSGQTIADQWGRGSARPRLSSPTLGKPTPAAAAMFQKPPSPARSLVQSSPVALCTFGQPSKNKLNVCNRTDIQAYFGDAPAYAGHCGDSPVRRKKKQ
jgi:hypothetical protein